MKANTAWILGAIATAAGWAWLIFGASTGTLPSSPRMFNLHLGAMAEQLCMLGYTLMLIGAVQSAATFMVERLSQRLQTPQPAPPSPQPAEEGSIDMSNLMTGQSMAARRKEAMELLNRKS